MYFPIGKWKNEESGIVYEGPNWVRDFKSELHQLPWFTQVSGTEKPTSNTMNKTENNISSQSKSKVLPNNSEKAIVRQDKQSGSTSISEESKTVAQNNSLNELEVKAGVAINQDAEIENVQPSNVAVNKDGTEADPDKVEADDDN